MMISHAELLALLRYDAQSGCFFWKRDLGNGVRSGDQAGRVNPQRGYRYICIKKKMHLAHRLAWFYVHGRWPRASHDIDHIDRNRDNNRIANLREATRSQNLRNSVAHHDSSSGIKGVSWDARRKRWSARVCVGGRTKRLGRFAELEAAQSAIRQFEVLACGEFAPPPNS